jgi:hypothetical protein
LEGWLSVPAPSGIDMRTNAELKSWESIDRVPILLAGYGKKWGRDNSMSILSKVSIRWFGGQWHYEITVIPRMLMRVSRLVGNQFSPLHLEAQGLLWRAYPRAVAGNRRRWSRLDSTHESTVASSV